MIMWPQVNESRRPISRTSGCSSVLSTTSDSGVGDTLATSGLVTPHQDRLTAFVYHQNSLSDRTSDRDREARAAAMSLIHASPQPESLNPRVPSMRSHLTPDRHSRRPYSNYPEANSSDDSSSCFTQSSASDLFIPRRPHPRSAYSDNDDPHNFQPRYVSCSTKYVVSECLKYLNYTIKGFLRLCIYIVCWVFNC